MSPRVGIVAALQREVAPLLRSFNRDCGSSGPDLFSRGDTLLVCAGIGAASAAKATTWLIAQGKPEVVMSVGFAGALVADCKVGDIITPGTVMDVDTGEKFSVSSGHGLLVSSSAVMTETEKCKLAMQFRATVVDMEAASVARVAQQNEVSFSAVKVISDELGFDMPPLQRFVDGGGQFRTSELLIYAAIRPAIWPVLVRLGANARKASAHLCDWLENQMSRNFHDIFSTQVMRP